MLKVSADKSQRGQSLIESIVAIFVLTMGLVSALSLAVYSFRTSDNTTHQIVATGLARQAVEAVKNIRDTNWLVEGAPDDCSSQLGAQQTCYLDWIGGRAPKANIQKISPGTYDVIFTPGSVQNWNLINASAPYTLDYDPSTGLYSKNGSGDASPYSRRVTIAFNSSAPYNGALNPLVTIDATVWWTSKQCAATNDPNTLKDNCKVDLVMYLTNWRNF